MKRNTCSGSTRSAVTVLALVLAVAVTGCGSTGSTTTAGSTPSSASPSAATSSAAPSVAPTDTATVTPTATPTATPVVVHAAKKGEPPLYAVAGFTYDDVAKDSSLAIPMAAGMNKSAKGLVTGLSAHTVDAADGMRMMLLEFTIGKKFVSQQSAIRSAIASAIAMMGGADAKRTTISTEKVYLSKGGTSLAYGWYHDGTLVYVLGGDDTDPETAAADAAAFVNGYLKAAHR